jgi:hypothetical protein
MATDEVNEEFWDRGPGLNDVTRCRDCEALVNQEDDLCETCQSGYIDWLIERDQALAASSPDHTHDSDGGRPSP